MITLEDYVKAIGYRITGGSDYGWSCFGDNARYLDCTHREDSDGDYSIHAIFDPETQVVYALEAWDYIRDIEYRWVNPEYRQAFEDESNTRGIDPDESLDGKKYSDLEVSEDILEKISKIVAGEEYDTRVKVPVNFSDEELFRYMKLAHEMDITFNELVEQALREEIARIRNENNTSI